MDERVVTEESGGPPGWLVGPVLSLAIAAVYARGLDAPFIFDDGPAIAKNKSIESLWPLVGADKKPGPLNPERSLPTSARPLVNLSFAINRYVGGLNPIAYHVVNIAIHFLNATLLWAIVRRTLRLPYFAGKFDTSAGWLALAVALLWAVHPLQTEAVIYATQRTELMMALFYLATLYCSLRYWSAAPLPLEEARGEGTVWSRRTMWLILAVLACLCGMASKEVMVSAPLMVLLFERTFIAGSLKEALRRSWPLYAGLAGTWLVLIALRVAAPLDHATGFGGEVPAYVWWLTQAKVFLTYLRLAVWPWPLLIHYQLPYVGFAEGMMYAMPVLVLGAATLVLLWRNRATGYVGAWVFVILSPTSLIPIYLEMAAERRMYLPLAAIVVLLVVGAYRLVQQWASRPDRVPARVPAGQFSLLATGVPVLLLAVVFAVVSATRLLAYSDEIGLWKQVLRYQPQNVMARNNLGCKLNEIGRYTEAVEVLETAVSMKPDTAPLNNLGLALISLSRPAEAVPHLEHAVQLKPDYAEAYNNLGNALLKIGRLPDAVKALSTALELKADYPIALNNLGIALIQSGQLPGAIDKLEHALRLKPDYADAYSNLGIALARSGKVPEAVDAFQRAIEHNPGHVGARVNLANNLAASGRLGEAIAQFEQAVKLQPDLVDAHNRLAFALQQAGRPEQAIERLRTALRLNPNNLQVYSNLAQALKMMNRPDEAIATAQQAIQVARSNKQDTAVKEIEKWLADYQDSLKSGGDKTTTTPVDPPRSN